MKRHIKEEERMLYAGEELEDIAGTYSGLCLVIGCGKTMWEDYAKAKELAPGCGDKMLVNMSIAIIQEEVQHLFSMHYRLMTSYQMIRRAWMPDDKAIVHSTREWAGVEKAWELQPYCSTSGLAGAQLALLLGYDKVILCGVPHDGQSHYYDIYKNPGHGDRDRSREVGQCTRWQNNQIKSFSGKTKEILGEPTIEWLRG